MSTIEDKILDGPTAHYCDAEDDDIRKDEDSNDSPETNNVDSVSSLFIRTDEEESRNSRNNRSISASINTGPKGVIEDYRKRFLPASRQSTLQNDELDAEFEQLMSDDSILKEYAMKRLAQEKDNCAKTFGQVLRLKTAAELLDAIDKEDPQILVVVHIYTKYHKLCAKVDECLDQLSHDLKHVKIVTLDAAVAGLSSNFKDNGVPALLVYKGGDLVKSLIQLEDLLDKDFGTKDLKDLLESNGLI